MSDPQGLQRQVTTPGGRAVRAEQLSGIATTGDQPLAIKGPAGRPQLVGPQWPLMIQDGNGSQVPDASFMISYANHEEKGSDVNEASHLLLDVLAGTVDGAMAISNDSDLRFPLQEARARIPSRRGVTVVGLKALAGRHRVRHAYINPPTQGHTRAHVTTRSRRGRREP